MTNAIPTQGHLAAPIDSDRKNFQRLFRMTFLFFVVTAMLGRLLPWGRRSSASSNGEHESLIEEAKRMANTILPFVFIR
jgi:hypothetical protein